jgi:hypothetical protein
VTALTLTVTQSNYSLLEALTGEFGGQYYNSMSL